MPYRLLKFENPTVLPLKKMSSHFVVKEGLCRTLRVDVKNGRKILFRIDGKGNALPGQPRIQLHGAELEEYMRRSHLVSELDKLAPYLRFVGSIRR